jgi:hypothetical protein
MLVTSRILRESTCAPLRPALTHLRRGCAIDLQACDGFDGWLVLA